MTNRTMTANQDEQLDRIVRKSCDIAAVAAGNYLRKEGVDVREIAFKVLSPCLKETVKGIFDEALDDARAAVDVNMDEVAVATFKAAMMIAGCRAGKLYLERTRR